MLIFKGEKYTQSELAEHLGVSKRTVYDYLKSGKKIQGDCIDESFTTHRKKRRAKRKLYRMGEAVKLTGMARSKIAFYDQVFGICKDREHGHDYRFTEKQINLLNVIKTDFLTEKGKRELIEKGELNFSIITNK